MHFQKWQKISFCTRKNFKTTKNAIFRLFSGAKIDFLPFLKMQIMCCCTFEIALFSNFRALWQVYSRDDFLGLVEIPLSVKEVSREPSGIKFWEIDEGMCYDLKTECTKFDTKGQIEIYHAYISTYDQPIYEIRRQYKARGNTVSISQGLAQSHFYDP